MTEDNILKKMCCISARRLSIYNTTEGFSPARPKIKKMLETLNQPFKTKILCVKSENRRNICMWATRENWFPISRIMTEFKNCEEATKFTTDVQNFNKKN
jgi:hypothetical protein